MGYTILQTLLRFLVRVVWRLKVTGLENIPARGPVLIASNHLSFIDSVLLPIVVPRRLRFLAKADYFEGPGLKGAVQKWFFTAVGAIPVQRDSQRDAMTSLTVALGVLQGGEAFGIYPEGTRTRDGRLYDGKSGVGWLSLKTNAPIVPTCLIGTDQVLPIGVNVPRLRPITVHFGAPVDPGPWLDAGTTGARARKEITDTVMDRIAEMSPQVRAHVVNDRAAPSGM